MKVLNKRIVPVSTAAIIGFFLTITIVQALSFSGQGTVSFDRIKTKKLSVSGGANFVGTIYNSTQSKPVYIDDNLRIRGKIWRGGTSGPGDQVPVIIDDNISVTGDIEASGSVSGTNITDLEDLAIFTILNFFYIDCVTTAAESTTYSESADIINCWNETFAASSQFKAMGHEALKQSLETAPAPKNK